MRKLRLELGLIVSFCMCIVLAACSDQGNAMVSTLNTVSAVARGQDSLTATPTLVATVPAPTATPTKDIATVTPIPTSIETSKIAPTSAPIDVSPSGSNMTGTPAAAHSTMVATGSLSEVLRGPKGKKEIAITLDAGAGAVAFNKEMAALDKYHVKITFFLTGAWVRENPQYAQQIAKDGMEIANHSYDHPWFTKLSNEKVLDEINSGARAIESVTGLSTKPLFRFPYGDYDARTMKLLNSQGYRSIYWTYDSLDSVGAHKTSEQLIHIVTSISDQHLDGAIILMHLGNDTSGDALGPIIANLEGRGFKIVTISQLISNS